MGNEAYHKMNGTMESFCLIEKACVVRCPTGTGPWPVAYLCGGDMSEQIAQFAVDGVQFLLVSANADWERDYTPWPAPALPGRAPFTGEAEGYLHFLTEVLKPYIDANYPVLTDSKHTALMGYSLGGLFALWAAFQTPVFGMSASLSGSLWYQGWLDYARFHCFQSSNVYLSLGRSEEQGGSPLMRTVGDCTRETAAVLEKQLGSGSVFLEWNRGGHFTGIPNRWKKALQWLSPLFLTIK